MKLRALKMVYAFLFHFIPYYYTLKAAHSQVQVLYEAVNSTKSSGRFHIYTSTHSRILIISPLKTLFFCVIILVQIKKMMKNQLFVNFKAVGPTMYKPSLFS